jgi:hypothetical protein
MKRTAAGLLLFAFTLAACAPVRWQKAGGDDAALARDLSACRKQAQERFGAAYGLAQMPSADPRFGPTGPTQADLRMQESQSVGTCMRGKGYALVPAEK